MIYSSIGPNPRFFAAMTNALASSGNSKNAHKSTVRRMVISTGAPSVGAVSKRSVAAQFPDLAHFIASSVARACSTVMPSPSTVMPSPSWDRRLEVTRPPKIFARTSAC